jgi:hypothetical protein
MALMQRDKWGALLRMTVLLDRYLQMSEMFLYIYGKENTPKSVLYLSYCKVTDNNSSIQLQIMYCYYNVIYI